MENEKRLIDANALIQNHGSDVTNFDNPYAVKISSIENAPTVDAVEVVHSSWILNDDGSGTCKNCHRTTKDCWDYDRWMNYCPNCGAKMDGDGNGN